MNFSTLRIYGTIPFQKDYKHTIDFESKTEQNAYFNTEFKKKGKSFSDFLYIDEFQKIIVEGAKGKYEGYNYLSFVNGDSNRTFYCFIDRFEYVSDDSTAIYFTVDVMQTYMFDYMKQPSLIDRMHVDRWNATDYLPNFNNICYNETLEINNYNIENLYTKVFPCCFVVVTLIDDSLGINSSGLNRAAFAFPALGAYKINNENSFTLYDLANSNFTNKINSIGIIHDIGEPYIVNNNNLTIDSSIVITIENKKVIDCNKCKLTKTYNDIINIPKVNDFTNWNDPTKYSLEYTESKLFISPYTRYFITDNINTTEEYLIRYINDNKITMKYNHIMGNDITESITIDNYKNVQNKDVNIDFVVGGNRYLPLTTNTWNNYMQTMAIKDFINIFASAGMGSVGGILGSIGNVVSTALLPNSTENNKSYFANLLQLYGNKIIFYKETIENKLAIINYFRAYGYSYPVFDYPITNSRYWFNYIKTKECNIYSVNLTNENMEKIKEIYNNGITFWHYNNGNYVWLDYTINNIERIFV